MDNCFVCISKRGIFINNNIIINNLYFLIIISNCFLRYYHFIHRHFIYATTPFKTKKIIINYLRAGYSKYAYWAAPSKDIKDIVLSSISTNQPL